VYLKSFFKVVYFMPYISSVVAIAVVWQVLYHPSAGPVNQDVKFGLKRELTQLHSTHNQRFYLKNGEICKLQENLYNKEDIFRYFKRLGTQNYAGFKIGISIDAAFSFVVLCGYSA
jgi:ABC-type sugar transport system permease subunit